MVIDTVARFGLAPMVLDTVALVPVSEVSPLGLPSAAQESSPEGPSGSGDAPHTSGPSCDSSCNALQIADPAAQGNQQPCKPYGVMLREARAVARTARKQKH